MEQAKHRKHSGQPCSKQSTGKELGGTANKQRDGDAQEEQTGQEQQHDSETQRREGSGPRVDERRNSKQSRGEAAGRKPNTTRRRKVEGRRPKRSTKKQRTETTCIVTSKAHPFPPPNNIVLKWHQNSFLNLSVSARTRDAAGNETRATPGAHAVAKR